MSTANYRKISPIKVSFDREQVLELWLTMCPEVLILEPMLATGGSAAKAIEVLKDNGVQESSIIFVNLVASRKGLDVVTKKFPAMQIVTAAVDNDLTASK